MNIEKFSDKKVLNPQFICLLAQNFKGLAAYICLEVK